MTKNVTIDNLFANSGAIKHDFYRIGVKLSETNHIKKLKKSPKFLLAVYRNRECKISYMPK